MDDRLTKIEEGLERLVPRGLSDSGKEALEAQIDELAEKAGEVGGGGWRRGAAAAAAVAVLGGLAWWQKGNDEEGRLAMAVPAAEEIPEGFETVSAALRVNEYFDGGVIHGDGATTPVRYHGYDLTEEREVVDEETGYAIQIRERREEWIGVQMTSL